MINWDEVSRAESTDELKEAKLWLFRENVRLENERKELDRQARQTALEKKRLKEENLFFEKKMSILQNGFRQLEEDRRALDRQKQQWERERQNLVQKKEAALLLPESTAGFLFRGTKNNPLALRKRYKDLMKIYHPDNLFGDAELVQLINREFARLKREF